MPDEMKNPDENYYGVTFVMNEEWWERPVCILCDWWWAFLLGIAFLLAAYFTRDLWLPLAPTPPTPTATRVADLQTGDVQVTLIWNTTDDLDLWVTGPSGEKIYYQDKNSNDGGELDVDANAGCNSVTNQPVENIFWPTANAPRGQYLIEVHYYDECEDRAPLDYQVRLLVDGQISEYSRRIMAKGDKQEVTTFTR